jgi:hypothetical protein
MSFTLKGLSYKVFNEVISAFIYVISSSFSPNGFFGDDILRHYQNDYHGVSPLFSHWVFEEFYPDISRHS